MENSAKKTLIKKVLGKFNPKEAAKGMAEEQEHAAVVGHNQKKIAEMVKPHLLKDPKYYDHLEAMENKYNKI